MLIERSIDLNKVDMDKCKTFLLESLINDMRISDRSSDPAEKVHLEHITDELSGAFDTALSKFTQLSSNVSDDSPVSILEIPPLIKR